MGLGIRILWHKLLAKKYVTPALLFIAVYAFLASIVLIGDGFKLLGEDFSAMLLATIKNPISGVFIGLLATAIVQSSSVTTSVIVGLCSAGVLPVQTAIPAVMGANIGTTITNSLVSLGHITRKEEFRRAFAGATVHDFFNFLSVLVLLPTEFFFHPLEHLSRYAASAFAGAGGLKFISPLKLVIMPLTDRVIELLTWIFSSPVNVGIAAVVGILVLFLALKVIVDCTRRLASGKLDALLNKYLFKAALPAFLLGLGLTAFIQSSSVATSIIIPFVGAGILSVRKIFPYTLGSNLGTTVTAILAALAVGSTLDIKCATLGVQIAFVHLFFNCLGICIWYPLRRVPISLAEKLGKFACEKRKTVILYIGLVFYIIPAAYIALARWL